MKLSTCVFIVLTFSYVVFASDPRKPDYPLYVCSVEQQDPYTDGELQKIATWFVHINTELAADQVDRLKVLNPDITVLGYINSSYAVGSSDLYILESKYRDAISMYWTATLPAKLAIF